MKHLKFTILGFFVVLIFSNFTNYTSNLDNNLIEIYFSNKLDINDLSKIKTDLFQQGIKLNYKSLKFGADDKLTQIDYYVTAGKFGGGDATEDTQKEIGFIINTDPNPKYGIIVGSKESIQKRRTVLESQN